MCMCRVQGVAIAWAVCEQLISKGCATLFATHFRQLAELTVLYPTAKLWRLQVGRMMGMDWIGLDWIGRFEPGKHQLGV